MRLRAMDDSQSDVAWARRKLAKLVRWLMRLLARGVLL